MTALIHCELHGGKRSLSFNHAAEQIVGPELPPASLSSNGSGTTMVSLTGGNPVNSAVMTLAGWSYRQIMKSQHHFSWLLKVLAVSLLTVTSVFLQTKNRIVQWSESPVSNRNTSTASGDVQILAQIEALEINDITVGGKSITIGQFFPIDDEWLKSLTVRVKNVSSQSISAAQMNLYLPETMPGGPVVTLCYGCDEVERGQGIKPGQEVEMKLVLYSWLSDQINAKSSFSMITRAEIHDIIVTLPEGRKWVSGCVRTATVKNACPMAAP
jgi:hypothetical protein